MNKLFSRAMMVAALASAMTVAVAAPSATDQAKTLFPNAKLKPMAGMIEVDTKVFVSADGKTVIVGGRTIDANVLLTGSAPAVAAQPPAAQAQQPQMPQPVDFSKLPLDKAIKVVKGNGSRQFAVFTDVDCPYCKQLEKTLAEVDNYTMYVFMMPIDQLHPAARAKSEAIWCTKDKPAAWREYWSEGKVPTGEKCATPLGEIAQLAEGLSIRGTPTLIRAKDGMVVPGAVPKEALEMFLNGSNLNR